MFEEETFQKRGNYDLFSSSSGPFLTYKHDWYGWEKSSQGVELKMIIVDYTYVVSQVEWKNA